MLIALRAMLNDAVGRFWAGASPHVPAGDDRPRVQRARSGDKRTRDRVLYPVLLLVEVL